MSTEAPKINGLLVLPRLRVQNANAISSPLTWGFPSITAFTGFMHALERRVREHTGLEFWKVGVVCHHHEAQVTRGGYTRSFHLTRNPVDKDGGSAAIVEEGRIHLEITLVFQVQFPVDQQNETQRQQLAEHVAAEAAGMRLAGGSIMPPATAGLGDHRTTRSRRWRADLLLLDADAEQSRLAFRRLSYRWLPGFALVSRDDLLQSRWNELRENKPNATLLDAWLGLSRLTHRSIQEQVADEKTGVTKEVVTWSAQRNKGWVVPIPVGYAALSRVYEPGAVAHARDNSTHFRFVESVYSMGQWISPHRLNSINDILWATEYDDVLGLYRCINSFKPSPSVQSTTPPSAAQAALSI